MSSSHGLVSQLRCLILVSFGCAAWSACGRSLATDFDDIESYELGGSGGAAGSVSAQGGTSTMQPSVGGAAGGLLGNGGSPVAGQGGGSMLPDPVSMWGCDNPVPMGNGFVSCASGMIHRPRIGREACLSELPRAEALDAADYAQIEQTAQARGLSLAQILALMPCIDDTDCVDARNGHCELAVGFTDNLTQCQYGCVRDSECGAGTICLCDSPVGSCASASCERDADCGPDLLCSSHDPYAGCGLITVPAFICQTFEDECGAHSDCGPGAPYCAHTGGQRECVSATGCPPI